MSRTYANMPQPTVAEWAKVYFLVDPVEGLKCLRDGLPLDHLLPAHMRPKPEEPRVRPRRAPEHIAAMSKAAVIKRRMHTPGWVYFVQAGQGGPIKIGITKTVYDRLINAQTFCPVPLLFLGAFEGTGVQEQELQFELGAIRFRGEWYWPHETLLARIAKLTADVIQPMPLGPLRWQNRDGK